MPRPVKCGYSYATSTTRPEAAIWRLIALTICAHITQKGRKSDDGKKGPHCHAKVRIENCGSQLSSRGRKREDLARKISGAISPKICSLMALIDCLYTMNQSMIVPIG